MRPRCSGWMKSPLMPITPARDHAMFAQIAAEQPDLQLPIEERAARVLAAARQGPRLGVATRPRLPDAVAVAGRGAQRRGAGVPVPLRLPHRCCGCCGSAATPPNCRTYGAIWCTEGPDVQARRRKPAGGVRASADPMDELRDAGQAPGPSGEPEWAPYQEPTVPA